MHSPLRPWILSIIFLGSFFFHLSLISKGPVTVDCLNLTVASQATLESNQLHYLPGAGYPLMVLLGSAFIALGKLLGPTDPIISVNFISILFSSIAVLVFYLLVETICDPIIAALASLLLLLNPLFIDVSTYGISHAPALCFLFLGMLSLLRFQTAGNKTNLLLSALYLGLMGAVRLQDCIVTFPAVCFLYWAGLKENGLKNKARSFLLFISIILLIIVLFHLPYFISDQTGYSHQARDYWKLNSMRSPSSGIFILSLCYLEKIFNFNIIGILCFAVSLYYTAKFNKKLLFFILLWSAVPLIVYGNITTSSPRFFTILVPAIVVPVSIFLGTMLKHKKMLWKIIVPVCYLMLLLRPLLNIYPTFSYRHHHRAITDFYLWVKQSTPPHAVIICCDDGPFIAYYAKRQTLVRPVAVRRRLELDEWNVFQRTLDKILNDKGQVYISEWTLIANDAYQEFQHLLRQHYELIEVGKKPMQVWYNTPLESDVWECRLYRIKAK